MSLNNSVQKLSYKTYSDYLRSNHWIKTKALCHKHYRNKCFICGSNIKLHVHHITYKNLGAEHIDDLVLLCEQHHQDTHALIKAGKATYSTSHFILKGESSPKPASTPKPKKKRGLPLVGKRQEQLNEMINERVPDKEILKTLQISSKQLMKHRRKLKRRKANRNSSQ